MFGNSTVSIDRPVPSKDPPGHVIDPIKRKFLKSKLKYIFINKLGICYPKIERLLALYYMQIHKQKDNGIIQYIALVDLDQNVSHFLFHHLISTLKILNSKPKFSITYLPSAIIFNTNNFLKLKFFKTDIFCTQIFKNF